MSSLFYFGNSSCSVARTLTRMDACPAQDLLLASVHVIFTLTQAHARKNDSRFAPFFFCEFIVLLWRNFTFCCTHAHAHGRMPCAGPAVGLCARNLMKSHIFDESEGGRCCSMLALNAFLNSMWPLNAPHEARTLELQLQRICR